jgi:hypothetical protein
MSAIVRLAIGKQTDRYDAPQTVGSMNGYSTDGIIHSKDAIHEFHANANQYSCNEADDGGPNGIYESAGRRDRHQACE